MKLIRRDKAKRSYLRYKKQTQLVPPKSSSEAGVSSMFNNAQNPHITGGSFSMTTNFKTENGTSISYAAAISSHVLASAISGPPMDVLYKRVAPHAILNAGGRADEVRCHSGTREEVIGHIEKWRNAPDGSSTPILWLSGPAGAGKSAIVQTIAERCDEHGAPHANFFFFRADVSRSHASPLIATLLHQIVLLYPSIRDIVAARLTTNPLIFDSTLENQLTQLIVAPLLAIQQTLSAHRPLLLLIDGLDECNSDTNRSPQQILHAFDKVLVKHTCPFRLLVASRYEFQIQMTFNRISADCLQLYLGDQYSPESDIRLFVKAQFAQVRNAHPLAHTLDGTWPSEADVESIVERSSGQFIYPATVMRFILESSTSPTFTLEMVLGTAHLAPALKLSYPHLGTICTYIEPNPQPTAIASATLMEFGSGTNAGISSKKDVYNTTVTNSMFISSAPTLDSFTLPDSSSSTSVLTSTFNGNNSWNANGNTDDSLFNIEMANILTWPTSMSQQSDFLDKFATEYSTGTTPRDLFLRSNLAASQNPIAHNLIASNGAASSSSSSSRSIVGPSSHFFTTWGPQPPDRDGPTIVDSADTRSKHKQEIQRQILSAGPSPFAPASLPKSSRSVPVTMVSVAGSSFPKTAESDQNIDVLSAWRRICANPNFKDVDITELCSEFTSKARCDGTKVVLEPRAINSILQKFSKKCS